MGYSNLNNLVIKVTCKTKIVKTNQNTIYKQNTKTQIIYLMQPSFNHNARQRPLQKSMFLPTADQFQHRNNSVQYQYQDIMKRSSINPDTNTLHSFHNNQNNNNFNINPGNNYQQISQNQVPPNIHQFNVNNNPILNFNSTPKHKQNNKFQQFQVYNTQIDSTTIQQLLQKIQKLTSLVQSHQDILKTNNSSLLKQQRQKSLSDVQIQQIKQKLRDSVIPSLINKETKQIYQHIFNFKIQINSLKKEVSTINDKNKNQLLAILEKSNGRKSGSTSNSSDRLQQPVSQLGSNVFSLQKKIEQIQKSIIKKDQQIISLIQVQIQKNRSDIQFSSRSPPKRLKQSTIQSTLSPIMLEYQQLFIIKNKPGIAKITLSNSKNKDESQIIINSSIYYIDKQGYLLDSQNRYIVDPKGFQIKLDQKHLAILKEYHVLN